MCIRSNNYVQQQKKKKIFFLRDKLFNWGDYPQVLGPHTLEATLLFHLLQKPRPSKKQPTKNPNFFLTCSPQIPVQ